MGRIIPGVIDANSLYTSEELGARLGIGVNTQRQWRRDGLRSVKVGRRLYYFGADVMRHIKRLDGAGQEPAIGEQIHAVVFREGGHSGFPSVLAVGSRSELEDAIRRLPASWQLLVAVVEVKDQLTPEGLRAAVDRLYSRVRVTLSVDSGEISVLRADVDEDSVFDKIEIIPCDRATGQQISEDDAQWFVQFWSERTASDMEGFRVVDVDAFDNVIQFCLER